MSTGTDPAENPGELDNPTSSTLAAPAFNQPEASDQDPTIDVDSNESDLDSALGSATSSYSASLASSVLNYKYENGRRYHAFREGEYPLPNDEREQERLDLLHHIFRLILDGALFRAPLPPHPQRILDFGTGTGIWAIDMADEHPSAMVIGTDLSPIQPNWTPPNCKFYVDDVESDWLYSPGERFDFIHGRGMGGGIRNWPRLFRQIYDNLQPGGWVELQEFEAKIRSEDDTISHAPWICEWDDKIKEASRSFGKDMNLAATHKQSLIDAGFVNVNDDVYKVPIGTWAKDKKLKELGLFEAAMMLDSVEPYTLALFTRVLQYSNEQAQLWMAMVRKELKDPKLHLYVTYHFTYGRKPT